MEHGVSCRIADWGMGIVDLRLRGQDAALGQDLSTARGTGRAGIQNQERIEHRA
jgi:hypothetical protein